MAIPQAPAAPEAAPPAETEQGGSATKAVSAVNDGFMQIAQMLDGSDAVDEDDKQKLAAAIQAFHAFVDGLGTPAAGAKPQPPQGAPVPMEAGNADVRPVM